MSDTVQPVLHDVTLSLSSTTIVYPGDSAPVVTRVSDMQQGDCLTASYLSMGCHVGTHVDTPSHFLPGTSNLDDLRSTSWYGPAVVINLEGRQKIEAQDLDNIELPKGQHILLKTDNSSLLQSHQFQKSYCWLSREAADVLCLKEPLSIGYDYYSLDPYGSATFPAHTRLADANIPVFVCLNLLEIQSGHYVFVGLPLRIASAEASPVRAFLIQH